MNNDQLMAKAAKIAFAFFYCDANKTPWQPFANYDETWIDRQVEDLEQTIYQSFKQGN